MSIQKQFILRYRDQGHVRFQIPQQFCQPVPAQALTSALRKLDGVYRVKLFSRQQKLSIRYQETFCDFKTLAGQLHHIVAGLTATPARLEPPQAPYGLVAKVKQQINGSTPARWFRRQLNDAKETVQAAKILTKSVKKNQALIDNPERFIGDFFNDILALYLIKLHWEQITKQWIPNPWKYRYEWLAVSYLLYLLMRSRNPKS